MENHTSIENQTLYPKALIFLIIGFAVGLGIGVFIASMVFAKHASVAEQTLKKLPSPLPSPAERWFIWSGSAPLTGEPFHSVSECETARANMVGYAITSSEQLRRRLRPMTIEEIALVGNPAVRIDEQLSQIQRAYCQRKDN